MYNIYILIDIYIFYIIKIVPLKGAKLFNNSPSSSFHTISKYEIYWGLKDGFETNTVFYNGC